MPGDPDHGARLSADEYERRIIDLHRGRPPMPTKEQDRELRRRELELAVDHRLGRAFPPERREALWAARERVERRRLRLGVRVLLARLVGRSAARAGQGLAASMAEEYAKVLTPAELTRFLGLEPGERPALPIDREGGRRRRAP